MEIDVGKEPAEFLSPCPTISRPPSPRPSAISGSGADASAGDAMLDELGVPLFIPMAFIHTGNQTLVAAVFIGLLGGLGNAAVIDNAIRACPPGLQGT